MRTFLKILKWTGIVLGVLILGLVLFIQFTWNKKFEAPYPNITASKDSAVIARGRYLAYGPAHCATCHMPMDKIMEVENTGVQLPLQGGWELTIPPGTFRAPNITPDPETGIGKLTDKELARTLRYCVGSDDRCIPPFMPFQQLSDEDLTAVISFLRSQEPVKNVVKKHEFNFLGKFVMAFGLIKPEGAKTPPPKSVPIDTTIEYGKYLANYVANCVGCHTDRDLKTGKFIGKPFAGGMKFEPDVFSNGYGFVSPNLTSDPKTGLLAKWTEDFFVSRLKKGRIHEGSPMAWGAFSRMNEVEIRAIYRYLKSLTPVENNVGKTVIPPVKKD